MAGRNNKRSSTPKRSTSTNSTPKSGRRVTRYPASKSTTATKPAAAGGLKKFAGPSTTGKRREIPPATRARHRVTSSTTRSVAFALDAPTGMNVAVGGTFNNWDPQPMAKGPDGLWRITLQLAPGTHQYKFSVDGQWQEDPSNPRRVQNDVGGFNSVCDVM